MAQEEGFSLIEMMVTLALTIGLSYFAVDNILMVKELAKLTENKIIISNLEEDVRATITQKSRFFATSKKNTYIKNCLLEDGKFCPTDSQDLKLWVSSKQPLPVKFYADGRRCNLDECPIEAKATYRGICELTSRCDKIASSLVEYTITAGDVVMKRGSIRRNVSSETFSDTNEVCENQPEGRKLLVSDMRAGRLNCVPAPPFERSITGAVSGTCVMGKEVLVGFDAEGAPVCEAIKFKGK